MDVRKVQSTGGSSFIITLPKDWIERNNIKKNDTLGVIQSPDGTLQITPHIQEEGLKKEITIEMDDIDTPRHLFRHLVGAYIMGYSIINVRSSDRIEPPFMDTIRRFVSIAIGPEITEETTTAVNIKDLLNPSEMPFDRTLKRMYIIVKTMHQDAITALVESDTELADNIMERDIEVDRLHWLAAHQYSILSTDTTLLRKMNISVEEATFYYLMSRILERIGDHALRIASSTKAIEPPISKNITAPLKDASELSLSLLDDSISAWFMKDIKKANTTRDSIDIVVKKCEAIEDVALKSDRVTALTLGYVAESIRRTGEYAGDICELAINHLIWLSHS